MDFLDFIKQKEIMIVVLAFIVYGLTYLVKMPIKLLTKRIKDEHQRAMINKVILIIPFALGLLAQFIADTIVKVPFNYNAGLTIGVSAISIYATFEKVFRGKTKHDYSCGDGKVMLEIAENKVDKKKVDQTDEVSVAAAEFLKKLNEIDTDK